MEISVQIEGAGGLNWSRWQTITSRIEQMGFAGIFCCDHFCSPGGETHDSLEVFTALTELASRSKRIHFGTLVAPFSFRDPVMLARQAMAIDDLSAGRMILGVGAGWNQREHSMFGYPLGDIQARMDRFEEGLEVVSRLVRRSGPANYEGKFYTLTDAEMLPRPARPTPILVGGSGPQRTLPLVARFADIWNYNGPLQGFIERSALLDGMLRSAGRQARDVKRTIMKAVICYQNQEQRETIAAATRLNFSMLTQTPTDDVYKWYTEQMGAITGEPAAVLDRLYEISAAGVEELMVQWFHTGDITGLDVIAEKVLPHFPSA